MHRQTHVDPEQHLLVVLVRASRSEFSNLKKRLTDHLALSCVRVQRRQLGGQRRDAPLQVRHHERPQPLLESVIRQIEIERNPLGQPALRVFGRELHVHRLQLVHDGAVSGRATRGVAVRVCLDHLDEPIVVPMVLRVHVQQLVVDVLGLLLPPEECQKLCTHLQCPVDVPDGLLFCRRVQHRQRLVVHPPILVYERLIQVQLAPLVLPLGPRKLGVLQLERPEPAQHGDGFLVVLGQVMSERQTDPTRGKLEIRSDFEPLGARIHKPGNVPQLELHL